MARKPARHRYPRDRHDEKDNDDRRHFENRPNGGEEGDIDGEVVTPMSKRDAADRKNARRRRPDRVFVAFALRTHEPNEANANRQDAERPQCGSWQEKAQEAERRADCDERPDPEKLSEKDVARPVSPVGKPSRQQRKIINVSVETKTTAAAAMSEISGIHESKRMLGRYETRMAESVIVKAISPARSGAGHPRPHPASAAAAQASQEFCTEARCLTSTVTCESDGNAARRSR